MVAADFAVVPTVTGALLFAFVVFSLARRRAVWHRKGIAGLPLAALAPHSHARGRLAKMVLCLFPPNGPVSDVDVGPEQKHRGVCIAVLVVFRDFPELREVKFTSALRINRSVNLA
jgi:hypothetical protein